MKRANKDPKKVEKCAQRPPKRYLSIHIERAPLPLSPSCRHSVHFQIPFLFWVYCPCKNVAITSLDCPTLVIFMIAAPLPILLQSPFNCHLHSILQKNSRVLRVVVSLLSFSTHLAIPISKNKSYFFNLSDTRSWANI